MAASINDKFMKVGTEGTLTTLLAPGKSIGASSINVESTSNWPTDTAVAFSIRQTITENGVKKTAPGTYTSWKGIVSGNSINNLQLLSGTDQEYGSGADFEVFINVIAGQVNSLIDGILAEHNQDGSHKQVPGFYIPTGLISPFGGSTAPTGWLIADGTAVSRSTYAGLFSVIGTSYGDGNGSTTFNLPNLKGRVPVGLDPDDEDFDTLGKSYGEKEHQLTTDEMPVHRHNVGRNAAAASGSSVWTVFHSDTASNQYNSGHSGGDQPHNNVQPSLVLNYIIKV